MSKALVTSLFAQSSHAITLITEGRAGASATNHFGMQVRAESREPRAAGAPAANHLGMKFRTESRDLRAAGASATKHLGMKVSAEI